jgi:hypothetical protein
MGSYMPTNGTGNYQQNSRNIQVTLACQAQKIDGSWVDASYDLTSASDLDIANIDGVLQNQGTDPIRGYVPSGSYKQTSRNIKVTLTVQVQKNDQSWVNASYDLTNASNLNLTNIDGVLQNQGISAAFTEIYDADSSKVNTKDTPYNNFDILYIAFAHINPVTMKLDFEDVKDGGKEAEKQRLANILDLVKPLRAEGNIKVVISLGFGYTFNDIPLIEENLSTFVPSVKQFLIDNNLDGFDIDYEEPFFTDVNSFRGVAQSIRAELGEEYLFTITPNNTESLDGETLNTYFDYVNVQSYDSPPNRIFPLTDFTTMPGLSKSKILAGASTDDGDKIADAVKKYTDNELGGVFAWKLSSTNLEPFNISSLLHESIMGSIAGQGIFDTGLPTMMF